MTPCRLPKRPQDAHKMLFGHALIIGGAEGMGGATRLAAEAAARVGAGLVTVATHATHYAFLNATRPEIISYKACIAEDLTPLLTRATVVAVGPGLGQSNWSQALFEKALQTLHPKIIDADALNLLSCNPQQRQDWILTPHPGEAARLLKCSTADIQHHRLDAAHQLQNQYGGIIVLKGHHTVVIDSAQTPWICTAGNPGMASAGMGDVLTGVIAGLLAQGLNLTEAAITGVDLHAQAADCAAVDGERGLLASDLMMHLRQLVNIK